MPVDSEIRKIIARNGNIKIDDMMLQVLSTNPSSYYQKQDKLGLLGDFTTAPEISQLFGEIIGLWVIDQWYKIGSPPKINLVELGPGQGTLMKDLLKVAKLVPEFYNSLNIQLIEINTHFRSKQTSNLKSYNLSIEHHSSIESMSELPSIIIANEFFDAMPIKQYIKNQDIWYESTLIIDPNDDQIKFNKIGINNNLQDYLQQAHPNAYNGAIIEESYKSLELIRAISTHLLQCGGSGLVIDYGYDIDPLNRRRNQYNPTLQAIKNHQYHPLLETLGEADLSAHVDFHALKTVAKNIGLKTGEVQTQQNFLIDNGILLRSQTLQNKLPPIEADIIARQVDRLISSDNMGSLFKVLCLTSK